MSNWKDNLQVLLNDLLEDLQTKDRIILEQSRGIKQLEQLNEILPDGRGFHVKRFTTIQKDLK